MSDVESLQYALDCFMEKYGVGVNNPLFIKCEAMNKKLKSLENLYGVSDSKFGEMNDAKSITDAMKSILSEYKVENYSQLYVLCSQIGKELEQIETLVNGTRYPIENLVKLLAMSTETKKQIDSSTNDEPKQ